MDVTYLRSFFDLEMVFDYAWGAATIAHIYRELNSGAHYKTSHLDIYLTHVIGIHNNELLIYLHAKHVFINSDMLMDACIF